MNHSVVPNHAVIILAAGASRRLGIAKQLLSIDGEMLINRTIRMALETQPRQTLVVLGYEADKIFATIKEDKIQRVDCPDWEQGMGASLRSGTRHVAPECSGALVLLCDQTELTTAHLDLICRMWRKHPERAVASAYANTVGVPALLPRNLFDSVANLQGDHGARELLRSDPSVINIAAPELVADVDTARDLPGYLS